VPSQSLRTAEKVELAHRHGEVRLFRKTDDQSVKHVSLTSESTLTQPAAVKTRCMVAVGPRIMKFTMSPGLPSLSAMRRGILRKRIVDAGQSGHGFAIARVVPEARSAA